MKILYFLKHGFAGVVFTAAFVTNASAEKINIPARRSWGGAQCILGVKTGIPVLVSNEAVKADTVLVAPKAICLKPMHYCAF